MFYVLKHLYLPLKKSTETRMHSVVETITILWEISRIYF